MKGGEGEGIEGSGESKTEMKTNLKGDEIKRLKQANSEYRKVLKWIGGLTGVEVEPDVLSKILDLLG